MGRFAKDTTVREEKSRSEIEKALKKFGAERFAYGWDGRKAMITFSVGGRLVRFTLALPDPAEERFVAYVDRWGGRRLRSDQAAAKAHEQESRRRWRALALGVKAKLVLVEEGITTIEEEFLSAIVDPASGQTMGEVAAPYLQAAYAGDRAVLPFREAR